MCFLGCVEREGEAGKSEGSGMQCVCTCVCVCMHVDNGNIYMNGPCIALHRHNSSDLEPSPAQSLQRGHKHKATLLFPIPVCVSGCILARFNNVTSLTTRAIISDERHLWIYSRLTGLDQLYGKVSGQWNREDSNGNLRHSRSLG